MKRYLRFWRSRANRSIRGCDQKGPQSGGQAVFPPPRRCPYGSCPVVEIVIPTIHGLAGLHRDRRQEFAPADEKRGGVTGFHFVARANLLSQTSKCEASMSRTLTSASSSTGRGGYL